MLVTEDRESTENFQKNFNFQLADDCFVRLRALWLYVPKRS